MSNFELDNATLNPCIAVRRSFLSLMKQFLRPIGQCLTTAVVTSAMLESYALPILSAPIKSPSQLAERSDAAAQNLTAQNLIVQTNAASLANPEAIAPPETVMVPPALVELPATPSESPAESTVEPSESASDAGGVPAGSTVQTDIEETASENGGSEISDVTSPNADLNTDLEDTDLEVNGSTPAQNVPTSLEEAIANTVALETARQELAEKLESIVEQDRPDREAELRQNLVAYALHYAEVGEFDQARQVAQHPALPTEIQTELLVKIEEIAAQQPTQPTTGETVTIVQAPNARLSYSTTGYPSISVRTLPPGLAGGYLGDRCLAPVQGDRANSEITASLSGVRFVAHPSAHKANQLASLLTISNAANETINLIQTSQQQELTGQTALTLSQVAQSRELAQAFESQIDLSKLGRHKQADPQSEIKANRAADPNLNSLLNKIGITTIPALFESIFLGQTYPTFSNANATQASAEVPTLSSVRQEMPDDSPNAAPDIISLDESALDSQAIAIGLSASLHKGVGKLNAIAPTQNSDWQKANSGSFTALAQNSGLGNVNCAAFASNGFGSNSFAPGYPLTTTLSQQFSRIGFTFPLPIQAVLTSAFGWRIHPITGDRRFHAGVDLGAPQGTPVVAAASGRVAVADYMGGYGLTVVLESQEVALRNLYAHLSGIAVQPGTWVERGSVIGWVGSTGNSTGPHLHFEAQQLTENGWVAVDPLANGATSVARAQ